MIPVFLFILGTACAQSTDFKLSDYKLPDLERRALETRFDLSGDNSYNKSQNLAGGSDKLGTNRFGGDVWLNYYHYLNNAAHQNESNAGIAFSSDLFNNKADNTLIYKNNSIATSFYYKSDNRKYYQNNTFIETDLNLNYQYNNHDIYTKSTYDGKVSKDHPQTHSLQAYLPLKTGTGRIEQVQDARHAIYLFEELAKVGRVNKEITNDEIIEFAGLISKLKN